MYRQKNDKCILCDCQSYHDLFEMNSYRIVKCKNCDFVFSTPLPSPDEILSLYSNEGQRTHNTRKLTRIRRNIKGRYFAKYNIEKHLKNETKINLLEIGCHQGDFLMLSKKTVNIIR